MYGTMVRRARISRGLTQADLAELSGVRQANISAIENERRQPSAETLHRLLFGCGYELIAEAGPNVVALPPPSGEPLPPVDHTVLREAPTVTAATPMADRVKIISAVLDTASAIARSR